MKNLIKNRLLRRFGPAKRVADVALVGGAALSYAQRKGYITEATAKKFGATNSSGGSNLSVGEMMLLVGAVFRMLKKLLAGRSTKKIIIDV